MRIAGPRSATTSSAASRILAIASSSKAGLTPLHPWLRTGDDHGVDVELDG
jgi:formate hydrogenlyase subunit 3/multisubunit Na+/H+ antiporter MnhD subunit